MDNLDRLTARRMTRGADQETFGYNQIGNITSKNGNGYTYHASKVHAVASVEGGDSRDYDDNGNVTRRGSLYLKYNPENQMVKAASDSNGSVYVARFACDGDGKRAKRVDNYGTVHYVGAHYERNVGTGADTTEVITRYYFAQMGKMRRLIAIRRGGTLYYVVPDHLGGTLRVVDTSGATIDDIRYHAFGGTRSGGTNLQTDKRFTGQTLDMSTGLYWYGSRAYDPVLGRFVQPDTIVPDHRNPQSLNRYSYVLNSPVRYTDPTGNMWEEADGDPAPDGSPDEDYPGNPTTPWELGWEWLTGQGPREQVFSEGDPMTEQLKTHSYLDEVRATMAERAAAWNYGTYRGRYDLSGPEGVPKYVGDYSNVLTGGRSGNLAVTFLGSYDIRSTVLAIDQEAATADVFFHVHNESTLASATHPPGIGYTPFWERNVEPVVNSLTSGGGPMSRTEQHFYWSETIRLR